jgi:MFS family permease
MIARHAPRVRPCVAAPEPAERTDTNAGRTPFATPAPWESMMDASAAGAGTPDWQDGAATTAGGGVRPGEKVPLRSYVSLGILVLMVMFSFLDRGIIMLIIDPIKADLGISDVQVSLIQGLAFALFYSASTLPLSWLADRWSRHGIIMIGITGWSIATVACGMATSFRQLFVARSAMGIGEAALQPAANSLVADLFPPRRLTLAIGVLAGGAALGSGAAQIIGGMVVSWAEHTGGIAGLKPWQTAFVVAGLPGFLIAPMVYLIPRVRRLRGEVAGATAAEVKKGLGDGYGGWLRENWRYVLFLSLGLACNATISYAQGSWAAAYLLRHFHMDVANVGLAMGVIGSIGGIIGFAGSGWVVDALVRRGGQNVHFQYLVGCVSLFGLLNLVTFGFVTSLPVLLVMMGVIFIVQPASPPALGHIQLATPRPYRARTTAILLLVMNLVGMTVGPTSVALVSTYFFNGPQDIGRAIAVVSAIVAVPGALCYMLAAAPGRRAREATARPG